MVRVQVAPPAFLGTPSALGEIGLYWRCGDARRFILGPARSDIYEVLERLMRLFTGRTWRRTEISAETTRLFERPASIPLHQTYRGDRHDVGLFRPLIATDGSMTEQPVMVTLESPAGLWRPLVCQSAGAADAHVLRAEEQRGKPTPWLRYLGETKTLSFIEAYVGALARGNGEPEILPRSALELEVERVIGRASRRK